MERYPEQSPDYIPKNMGQLRLTSFILDQLQEVNTVWRIARDAQDWQTVQEVEEHEQQLYRDLDSWDKLIHNDGWSYK
jgi:hypothetical protein